MYVEIDGIPQWIQIESDNPKNPALLIVHGGPGASTTLASTAWQSWRSHFTVVHWDQRGAGRTFVRNGEAQSQPMTFDQIVLDGIGVTEFLQTHLNQRSIYLLGHSWGAAISTHMAKRRPELFKALITTGLPVNFAQNEQANYERELAQARQQNNQAALTALLEIGPPPHNDPNKVKVLRDWADKLADGTGDSPAPKVALPVGFSAEERAILFQGFAFSVASLFGELCAVDLPSLGLDFEIPMLCLMGTHDQQTPFELAECYFATINAPRKAFVHFEGCHHFVFMNRPDDFLQAMIQHLPEITDEH